MSNWLSSEVFLEWLSEQVINSLDRVVILGLGGYPFSGKTTISRLLARRFPGSVIVPMESYILPRQAREERRLDGCSFEAHDVVRLQEDICKLLVSEPIFLREYSWDTGDYLCSSIEARLKSGGIIILDGTASGSPAIEIDSSLSIFFVPEHPEEWLEHASQRDFQERNWSSHESIAQNEAKARTCAAYCTLGGTAGRRDVYFSIDKKAGGMGTKFSYRLTNSA